MKALIQKLDTSRRSTPRKKKPARRTVAAKKIEKAERFWEDIKELDEPPNAGVASPDAVKQALVEGAVNWLEEFGGLDTQYRILIVNGEKTVKCESKVRVVTVEDVVAPDDDDFDEDDE